MRRSEYTYATLLFTFWLLVVKLADFGCERFAELSSKLVASSQLAVHPPEVRKGGLQGVLEGMEDLKQGRVSGVKLVYRVDETT